jgi:hypothetical protein
MLDLVLGHGDAGKVGNAAHIGGVDGHGTPRKGAARL